MTCIIILAAPNTLSQQLAALQRQGLVPSGPPIKWDSRKSDYPDYLAPEVRS